MQERFGILACAALLTASDVVGQALTPVAQPESIQLSAVGVSAGAPKIEFAEMTHDFGEVQSGLTLKHTFEYTNTGTAALEIVQVRPSCGCTTAGEWDKRVEPGAKGQIPIQFSTASFNGLIQKTVSVETNDPQQKTVVLHVKATVWVPMDVTPKTVMFQYDSESPAAATQSIRIISNMKEPLQLLKPEIQHPAFQTELVTVTEGKEYELKVHLMPPVGTGMISSPFFVRAADTNVEPVRVQAYAVERQPIVVSPSQLMIPAGKGENSFRPSITIRSQSTNELVLSDPAVNVSGVTVEMKELQPGKLYALTPTFPAGFALPAGQRVEVTVKSNHPKHPVIRVPVVQPRQVARMPVQVPGTRVLPVRTNAVTRTVPVP